MQIQEIRDAYYAKPFKPFVIRLLDGRRFLIAKQYSLAIAPSEKEVACFKPDGGFAFIGLEQVDHLEHFNVGCARNRKDVRRTSSPWTGDGHGLEVLRTTKMRARRACDNLRL